MRGIGYFILFLSVVVFVLTFGLGFLVYAPMAAFGLLFVIAGNTAPQPPPRYRSRYRRR